MAACQHGGQGKWASCCSVVCVAISECSCRMCVSLLLAAAGRGRARGRAILVITGRKRTTNSGKCYFRGLPHLLHQGEVLSLRDLVHETTSPLWFFSINYLRKKKGSVVLFLEINYLSKKKRGCNGVKSIEVPPSALPPLASTRALWWRALGTAAIRAARSHAIRAAHPWPRGRLGPVAIAVSARARRST